MKTKESCKISHLGDNALTKIDNKRRVEGMFALTLFFFFSVFSQSALTTEAKPLFDTQTTRIIKLIEKKYDALGSWKAQFTQVRKSPGLPEAKNKGSFYYSVKTNNFKFALQGPEYTEVLKNGNELWNIDYGSSPKAIPAVTHYTSTTQMNLEKYLILFRGIQESDFKKLKKHYDVVASEENGHLKLKLSPLKDAEVQSIELHFKSGSQGLSQAIITDYTFNKNILTINRFSSLTQKDHKEFKVSFPKDAKITKH